MKKQFMGVIRRLEEKGFSESDIPSLMRVMLHLLYRDLDLSLTNANSALKERGWGSRPLDSLTFHMLKSTIGFGE